MPSAGRANMLDRLDSFVMAETLKYAFMLAAPRGGGGGSGDWADILSLRGWVLNTEAHPLRIPSDGPSAWPKVAPKRIDGGEGGEVHADPNDLDEEEGEEQLEL